MKILSIAVLFLATIATAHAFAQTKTRAQVYRELIHAQRDGRDYVTDTSYADMNPIFTHQLEQQEVRLAQNQTTNEVANSTATHSPGATN
jgi:hypothetical protein